MGLHVAPQVLQEVECLTAQGTQELLIACCVSPHTMQVEQLQSLACLAALWALEDIDAVEFLGVVAERSSATELLLAGVTSVRPSSSTFTCLALPVEQKVAVQTSLGFIQYPTLTTHQQPMLSTVFLVFLHQFLGGKNFATRTNNITRSIRVKNSHVFAQGILPLKALPTLHTLELLDTGMTDFMFLQVCSGRKGLLTDWTFMLLFVIFVLPFNNHFFNVEVLILFFILKRQGFPYVLQSVSILRLCMTSSVRQIFIFHALLVFLLSFLP